MSGANLRCSVIDRGKQPGLLNPLWQPRGKARRARVTCFQFVHRRGQIFRDARLAHLEVAKNISDIGIRVFNQLQQKVFRLHFVIRARETEPGSAFKRAATGTIESCNQRFQVYSHDPTLSFNKTGARSC